MHLDEHREKALGAQLETEPKQKCFGQKLRILSLNPQISLHFIASGTIVISTIVDEVLGFIIATMLFTFSVPNGMTEINYLLNFSL